MSDPPLLEVSSVVKTYRVGGRRALSRAKTPGQRWPA